MENFDTMPRVETNDSDWQKLKQESAVQVEEVKQGLENLPLAEKIAALKDLLETLQSDNKNRYLYRDISLVLEEYVLDKRYEEEKEHFRKIRAVHEMV